MYINQVALLKNEDLERDAFSNWQHALFGGYKGKFLEYLVAIGLREQEELDRVTKKADNKDIAAAKDSLARFREMGGLSAYQ